MFSILCLYKPVILPDISVLSLCVHKQLGGTGSVSGYFFVPLRCHRYSFLLLNSCIPHHLEHLDEIRGESWPFATQVAEIPVFPQGQDFPICLWKRGESQAPILNLSQHLKKKKTLLTDVFQPKSPPVWGMAQSHGQFDGRTWREDRGCPWVRHLSAPCFHTLPNPFLVTRRRNCLPSGESSG